MRISLHTSKGSEEKSLHTAKQDLILTITTWDPRAALYQAGTIGNAYQGIKTSRAAAALID